MKTGEPSATSFVSLLPWLLSEFNSILSVDSLKKKNQQGDLSRLGDLNKSKKTFILPMANL